jgi:hypothetical protein
MCVLAHRFNYKFEKYNISLCGAYSKIALKSNPKQKLDLFMPGNEDKFNIGLTYLLDCLNALCSNV